MRLRFEERELELLKGAEQLGGRAMTHSARADELRTALSLARAGHKIARAAPGASVSLDQGELNLLIHALRHASREIQWAQRVDETRDALRRDHVLKAFPELTQKGVWRTFGLSRELEAIATRLEAALRG